MIYFVFFFSFIYFLFFFSSRRRHTRSKRDWSSDVCSSDLGSRHHREQRRSAKTQRRSEDSCRCGGSSCSLGCGCRSEERRVGKEGRFRRSPDEYKKRE